MRPFGAHAGVLGKSNDLNFGIQSRCVLCAAEKSKWPFEVSPYGTMKYVHVFRGITSAPFQAEDIDGLRHGGRMIAVDGKLFWANLWVFLRNKIINIGCARKGFLERE
jgi:hypothetical protein